MLWLQAMLPFWHAVMPAAHTPGLPVLQFCPPPGLPSSTCPLQLLSRPSHVSAEGGSTSLQTIDPLVHAVMPAEQTPALPVSQATSPPGSPSSTAPLQLLSMPSQISGDGCTF